LKKNKIPILISFLTAVAMIFFLMFRCGESRPREIMRYQPTEKEKRRANMITILNATLGTNGPRYYAIISNLCNTGKIQHSSHRIILNAKEVRERQGPNQEGPHIQELRQNISDLQNRVFELEDQMNKR